MEEILHLVVTVGSMGISRSSNSYASMIIGSWL